MKKNTQFEAWAIKFLSRIQKTLLLEDHAPLTIETPCKSQNADAECQFRYPYKSIIIRYEQSLADRWHKGEREYVNKVLTHEMCHVLTDPLYAKATSRFLTRDEIEDERERLTDHLANILVKNKLI